MTTGIALLGATGSIGRTTVAVVRQHPDRLRVVSLAAGGSKPEELVELARELSPALVAVADEKAAPEVARSLPGVEVVSGAEGVERAAVAPGVEKVVAAIVGAAGLTPVYRAVEAGLDVALANKEAMVVAGRLLRELAHRTGGALLPVDSEHAALHQALRAGERREVARLVLTASGGPFRTRPIETWNEITPEDALRHPTWEMGPKITIDSATLMNKGLEVIEARHLFDVAEEMIDVVVHPQSQVHSLVEYRDGTWLAQLSPNDMVFSVQYALAYPERWGNDFPRLEPSALGRLDFEPVDEERFPAIALARAALRDGDMGPIVLNAANEVAVAAFLDGRIGFRDIVAVVERALEKGEAGAVDSLEDALACDARARRLAHAITRTI